MVKLLRTVNSKSEKVASLWISRAVCWWSKGLSCS